MLVVLDADTWAEVRLSVLESFRCVSVAGQMPLERGPRITLAQAHWENSVNVEQGIRCDHDMFLLI